MKAQQTAIGGRHCASERGAYTVDESPEWTRPPLAKAPLLERLPPGSLVEVASFCGISVQDLIRRTVH